MVAKLLRTTVPARWRPSGYLRKLVVDRTNQRVVAGPFAGMHYVGSAHLSAYLPKLLGIYEKEIAGCVEAALAARPDTIIDVGAAEGYYAVGLALRSPGIPVVAFEMDEQARERLEELAALNGVADRLQIHGRCDLPDLVAALENTVRPLVICDVEGYEDTLLDPERVSGLARARVLVELHEFAVRGVAETIEKRFAPTHRVTRVWQVARTPAELPYSTWYTALMPRSSFQWAVGEQRPERMSWLWMEPLREEPGD